VKEAQLDAQKLADRLGEKEERGDPEDRSEAVE
jgi:hypothetical protein